MRILFVHGRAQGGKDQAALKQTWIETLSRGLTAANIELPDGVGFDFPFYGDTLDDFTERAGLPSEDVLAKGPGDDRNFKDFMTSALDEMYESSTLTDEEVEAEMDPDQPREKGPQNWGWVQAIARAIDRRFTDESEWTINKFLKDVYLYVNSSAVTRGINRIVEDELTDEPTVVVGHSLGSVVAYRVLVANRSDIRLLKYVTVGSPLGIRAISSKLGIPENTAEFGWYNAYDEGDIVALNPLDGEHFPTDPAIVNNNRVHNATDNQHGIVGYLDDPLIAGAIAESLIS